MATQLSGEGANLPQPAILVVDDDPAITRSLARSLRDRFTVFTANSADAALAIIARETIAVILTDQRMPDISGVQLLERARDLRPEAIGILISGYTDISALVDALNLGNVRGFLPKPWDIHQLRRQLDQAVRSYQAGFLDRTVLRNTADAVNHARAQVAELRRALDELASGNPATLFEQWERTRRDARYGPGNTPLQASFYEGPPPGDAPLSQRLPEIFVSLVADQSAILDQAVEHRGYRIEGRFSDNLRALGERLGTLWASPRDVIEVHTAALKSRLTGAPGARISVYAEEGRLLLPELMGNLVVFYRGWLVATLVHPTAPDDGRSSVPPAKP